MKAPPDSPADSITVPLWFDPAEGLSRGPSRTLRYFLRGAVLVWLLPSFSYLLSGRMGGFFVNLAGASLSGLVLGLWHKRKLSYEVAVRAGLGVSTVCLLAESFLIGQGDSQSAWYLVAIALASGYLSSGPEILFWAAAVAAIQLLIRGLQTVSPVIPEYVIRGWEVSAGQVVLTLLCATFAYFSRSIADERLRQVLQREGIIRQQAKLLEEARDQAVAATQAKSRFLSTVSHEIRTPLYGILGAAQAIETELLGEKDHESVTTIVQSGELLLAVLNDVLDSAKLDAGELSLHHRAFQLRENLEAACRLVRPLTERKGLSLVLDIPDDVPTHWLGDDLRIRQILLNLLNNACKFSTSGTVTLRAEGNAAELRLIVSDQGIGISEDDQPHLFQPFRQVVEGDARRHDGTGLGLWITRRLASLMNGEVTLESVPGRGSVFTVKLPLIATAMAPPAARTEVAPPARVLNVLVVDDNPVNRKVTLNLLKRLGHTAIAVEGGQLALEAVLETAYDVILMDLQMPDMDGIEATTAIRALTTIEQPEIIAFSADAQAGKKLEFGPHAFAAFLGKPLRMQQLGDCLTSITSATESSVSGLGIGDGV